MARLHRLTHSITYSQKWCNRGYTDACENGFKLMESQRIVK